MSQSPFIPSPLTTPPLQSTARDPSIVHPAATEEYLLDDHPYYPSSAYHHTAHYDHSPGASRKAPAMYPSTMLSEIGHVGLASAPIITKPKRDMNFAKKDSTAAKPGIQTPLASYAAQMVVWLWFGNISPPVYSPTGAPVNPDPFEYPRHPSTPLNPLQVAPSAEFTRFVAQLLQITMVSHSVTLVALLYIYRLKRRYNIEAGPGTEMRPFIASLILSNKYLDDNTYTNKTWADLTGLPVAEIGKMETEFLRGLEYRLCVEKSDYETWHHLLDGFIRSRSNTGIYRSRFNPDYTYSPPNNLLLTPATAQIPSNHYIPSPADIRARSVSPTLPSPELHPQVVTPGYGYARKRSAVAAFAAEPLPSSIPPAHYYTTAPPPPKFTRPPLPVSLNSGLARSASLNRQIARLPGVGLGLSRASRRGSAGCANPLGLSSMPGEDLRHIAANHAVQQSFERAAGNSQEAQDGWWDSLVAPYSQHPEAHAIPPEQLVFYTISAQAHPGQDGAPRKAILRHQQPHPYSYPPHLQPYTMANQSTYGAQEMLQLSPATARDPSLPAPAQPYYPNPAYEGYYPAPHSYPAPLPQHPGVISEPGQFADAGPPGYAYDPELYAAGQAMDYSQLQAQAHMQAEAQIESSRRENGYGQGSGANPNRWSTTSEDMMAYNHVHGPGGMSHGGHAGEWRTRSEWSSPMPGYEGWTG